MVEDAWRQFGIGGLLLREVAVHASRTGLTTPKARILAGQSWIFRMLRRYGTCEADRAGEVCEVSRYIDDDLVPQAR